MRQVAKDKWTAFGNAMIQHGREICIAPFSRSGGKRLPPYGKLVWPHPARGCFYVCIPVKTATHSDSKSPPVPLKLASGSNPNPPPALIETRHLDGWLRRMYGLSRP